MSHGIELVRKVDALQWIVAQRIWHGFGIHFFRKKKKYDRSYRSGQKVKETPRGRLWICRTGRKGGGFMKFEETEMSGSTKPDIVSLQRKLQQAICQKGLGGTCMVNVEKHDKWYVLRGKVNSSETKASLLRMIPRDKGAQWIVDQLRVGRPRR
jgi:hypothetical protein